MKDEDGKAQDGPGAPEGRPGPQEGRSDSELERRDETEHLRARLVKWCDAAVERTTADMVAIETHSAVRNVMRLFERIKDYEKRVIARRGALGTADMDALLAALTTLTQMLGPLAPHIAEELFEALGGEGTGAQTPWPRVSFKVAA